MAEEPVRPAARSRSGQALRVQLLESVKDRLSDAELMQFTLHQAVAETGGLGGMLHRTGPGDRRLKVAASCGLPRETTDRWQNLGRDEQVAPAVAMREEKMVWLPARSGTPPASASPPPAATTAPGAHRNPLTPGSAESPRPAPDGYWRGFPVGAGLASVPLLGPKGPMGSLSVLTAEPGLPDAGKQEFLWTLAEIVSERMRRTRSLTRAPRPAWWQPPTEPPERAGRAISVGAWDWDLPTGRLVADDAALRVFGLTQDTFDQQIETWVSMVHSEDIAGVLAEIDRVIAEGSSAFSMEYRIYQAGGDLAWVEVRGYLSYDENGRPLHMSGTAWDVTETRMARDSVGRALQHMSDGFLALDDEWRIMYCNAVAERVFGASGRLLGRVLWEAVPDVSAFGLEERYRQLAIEDGPVGFDVRAPADRRWYHMRLVAVPGGLTVYFTDVTDQRARQAERDRSVRVGAERNARISELTESLAQALTVRDVVDTSVDRVMPLFGADGLVLSLVEGSRIRTVGSVGYRPGYIEGFDGMAVMDLPPAADVLGGGSPKFFPSPGDLVDRYPEMARMPAEDRKRAWAVLPLVASGRSIGFCVVSFADSREFTEEERTLLVALSGLVAHALERARLYDAEHSLAQELQSGMLPSNLPDLPAITPAARYLSAGEGMEVGGDWYDVIPLSAERVALVVGDVVGHGLPEAVAMGRLRTAVHTLADLETSPDELFARLNSLVTDLGDASYATCLYAIYDPTTRMLSFASAGHPPPVVATPNGRVYFPKVDPDPPLGVATPPFRTVELELPEDSVLVFFTDGLVESLDSDIEYGMNRLAETVSSALGESGPAGEGGQDSADPEDVRARLERLCDTLTSTLVPDGTLTGDDTALLVARTHALPSEDIGVWRLPDDAIAAGQARKHVSAQLDAWGLDDLSVTTELLVSELVGNVVRHAKGPVQLRLLRGKSLICEVSDGSLTTPRIRHAAETDEGGRGLQLVAALAHRWGARYTGTGKTIWTEQTLPPH